MRKLLLLSMLLGLIVPPAARADQKEDDAALRQRNDEFCAAWNKHDARLMAALFAADGDLINPFGRRAHGTAEIEKLFTTEQTGPMAGSTYTGTVESIRYVGTALAIVDVSGEITGMKGPDGAAAPPFKHHVTWIVEKKADKWLSIAVRAFVTLPPPAAPAK